MHNKYYMHQGVERVDFIIKYTGSNIPTGLCVTNLPSAGTTTTTTPSTTTTTTTTTPSTTTTTTAPPTTAPSSTTTSSTGNDVYQVPVVKVEEPWGGGSSWTFKAKCTFEISQTWPPETLPVDLLFNQETSNIQVSHVFFYVVVSNNQKICYIKTIPLSY